MFTIFYPKFKNINAKKNIIIMCKNTDGLDILFGTVRIVEIKSWMIVFLVKVYQLNFYYPKKIHVLFSYVAIEFRLTSQYLNVKIQSKLMLKIK